ncbi:cell wall integrity and stress response component 2-like [Haliotis rubra]|uniref:cell wall integrity and stress response component 2-like n=1 Tax=Haliotis rubra TaxID=36100 RepID=UPI001EE57D9C|nr:cell wall integrity and stress response component 2-like [Haliotis rubra]
MKRMLVWTSWASATVVMTVVGLPFEPMHFTLYENSMTWNEAARMCEGNGQRLFNLDSHSKATVFGGIVAKWRAIGKLGSKEDIWSGLHDRNKPNRDYRWSDCTALSWSIWYSGEPNYWNTDHCIRLDDKGLRFRTDLCNKNYKFVCEHKLGGCWFETFGGSKLSGSLHNAGGLGYTQCLKMCETYTEGGNECVATSVDNDGTCWLSMDLDLSVVDTPAMACSSTTITDIKRCHSYSSRVQSSSYTNNNRVPQYTCTSLSPTAPVTPSVTTTTMPGCVYVPTTMTSTTTTTTTTTTVITNPTVSVTTPPTTTESITTMPSMLLTTTTTVSPSTTSTRASTVMTSTTTSPTDTTSVTTISSPTASGPASSTITSISPPSTHSTASTSTDPDKVLNKKASKLCPCSGLGRRSRNQFRLTVDMLVVDKATLSKSKRKLTSAHDDRESAMVIGASGVTIVSCFMLVIFLLDCDRILRQKNVQRR